MTTPRRMGRGLAGGAIAIGMVLVLAACVGDDATPGAGQGEGGTSSGGGETPSTSDAARDPTTPDGASPVESGAPSDAGDAASPFCAGKALAFCADFDTVPAVDTGWAQKNVVGNAAIDLVATDFVSAPKSALFRQGTAPGQNARMTTAPLATGGKRSATLRFRWRRSAFTFSAAAQGSELLSIVENGKAKIALEVGADLGMRLRVDTSAPATLSLVAKVPKPADGKWIDVSLRTTFDDTTAGQFELKLDGEIVATKSGAKTSLDATTTTIMLGMGPTSLAFADGQQPAIESLVDDVTLTFQ